MEDNKELCLFTPFYSDFVEGKYRKKSTKEFEKDGIFKGHSMNIKATLQRGCKRNCSFILLGAQRLKLGFIAIPEKHNSDQFSGWAKKSLAP